MDGSAFDILARALGAAGSRRRAVVAALGGSLAALGGGETAAKKKCPPCEICPPPVSFCAGKNSCGAGGTALCSQPESSPECACLIRADTAESFCGTGVMLADTCAFCAPGTVCVVLGGVCPCG